MLSTKKITAALTLSIAAAFALSACSMGSATPAESSPGAMMQESPSATPIETLSRAGRVHWPPSIETASREWKPWWTE